MRSLGVLAVAVAFVSLSTGCVRRVVLPPQQPLRDEPPAGMLDVNIVSDDEGQRWDVHTGGKSVCSTPCTQRLQQGDNLVLLADDGDELFVDAIGLDQPGLKRALVVAEGSNRAKRVNGIVFTTFGGMGTVIGITFTAIGCSNLQERAGLCTAGLITGGVSLPLTAFSIWLMIDALPKAHVMPVMQAEVLKGHPPVTMALTPNGVAGTF